MALWVPVSLFCWAICISHKMRCWRQVDQGNDKGREESGLDWVLVELLFKFVIGVACHDGRCTGGWDYLPSYAKGPVRLNVPKKMRDKA